MAELRAFDNGSLVVVVAVSRSLSLVVASSKLEVSRACAGEACGGTDRASTEQRVDDVSPSTPFTT